MDEAKEIKATRKPDTPRKKKWLGDALGISVSVYIDKLLENPPKVITIRLEEE